MSNYKITYSNELYHFGIKGQKWGQRRFQNDDGSLTAAGRQRYGYSEGAENYRSGMLKATSLAGPLGGALYKARHKEEAARYSAEKKQIKQERAEDKQKSRQARLDEKQRLKEQKAHYKNDYLDSKGKMRAFDDDTAVTKKVKKDWNNLSDDEFKKVYGTSKELYAKRVQKYGDPYKNSPLAKAGKKINDSAYGKAVNSRMFNEKRNTRKMARKAARKTLEQDRTIKSLSNSAAAALVSTGHPIAAGIVKGTSYVIRGGNVVRNVKKSKKEINTSNEYLRKQRAANLAG